MDWLCFTISVVALANVFVALFEPRQDRRSVHAVLGWLVAAMAFGSMAGEGLR